MLNAWSRYHGVSNLYFPFKILSVSNDVFNLPFFFFYRSKAVDVQNIQHISDDREFIGDDWECLGVWLLLFFK